MKNRGSSSELDLHTRIRNRRMALGLSGTELAQRAGISPSYLSLIENGAKLPSEEIAVRIARALDDEEDLYVVWARSDRIKDVRTDVRRLLRFLRLKSRPDLRSRVRTGEDLPPPAAVVRQASLQRAGERMRWAKRRSAAPDAPIEEAFALAAMSDVADYATEPPLLEVPLLEEGGDPGDSPASSRSVIDMLRLDPRLLPPEVEEPFAYRVGPRMIRAVEDTIRPDDLVLLTRRVPLPIVGNIYAVRHEGRIVLSRLVHHGQMLLLLDPNRKDRQAAFEVPDASAVERHVVGMVVANLRSWSVPAPREPDRRARRSRPRGRSVSVEGDFLVRDCDWKEDYGWRPVQRPEDLDWLEQHPGTKIRFRLRRDNRVQYSLEMTPDEWREALGDYVEGDTWRRNGYIVAVTKRREGKYTDEFQDRWAPHVRERES